MSNPSNLPPGLSSAISYSAAEVRCANDHSWIQHRSFEGDTGASYAGDDEETCPVCGEDPDPTEDRVLDDDWDFDPDRARDEAMDR